MTSGTGFDISPRPSSAVSVLPDHLRAAVADAVDDLQLAALLESAGITDDVARDRYGAPDVFGLASDLRDEPDDHGAPAHAGARQDQRALPLQRSPAGSASSIGHGVIYLLPAVSFPALLDLVGVRHAAAALVVGASAGWLWAVPATWRAYSRQVLGSRDDAVRELRRAALRGAILGLVAAAALILLGNTPPVVGLVAASVTLAHVGITLLVFLRRLPTLGIVLGAQAVVGLGNLLFPTLVPPEWVLVAFVLTAVTLLVIGGAIGARVVDRGSAVDPAPLPRSVLWFAAASTAFLLLPQWVFLRIGGLLPLALAGLFLTMGFVEWRSAALSSRLRDELSMVATVSGFRRRTARLVTLEGAACATVTGLATLAVLLVLRSVTTLSPAILLVALTAIPLATAYLISLVLANSRAHAWLAGCFTGGTAVEASLWGALRTPPGVAFAAATGVLLLTLAIGLLTRPVDRFR